MKPIESVVHAISPFPLCFILSNEIGLRKTVSIYDLHDLRCRNLARVHICCPRTSAQRASTKTMKLKPTRTKPYVFSFHRAPPERHAPCFFSRQILFFKILENVSIWSCINSGLEFVLQIIESLFFGWLKTVFLKTIANKVAAFNPYYFF